MARARDAGDVRAGSRSDVLAPAHRADGQPRRLAAPEAFRELDAVLLLSLGRHEALPRAAAVELGLDEGRVHGGAGPQALDRAADEGAVARPEEGRAGAHADRVHGITSKAAPRARRSSRKVG